MKEPPPSKASTRDSTPNCVHQQAPKPSPCSGCKACSSRASGGGGAPEAVSQAPPLLGPASATLAKEKLLAIQLRIDWPGHVVWQCPGSNCFSQERHQGAEPFWNLTVISDLRRETEKSDHCVKWSFLCLKKILQQAGDATLSAQCLFDFPKSSGSNLSGPYT